MRARTAEDKSVCMILLHACAIQSPCGGGGCVAAASVTCGITEVTLNHPGLIALAPPKLLLARVL